MPIPVLTIYDDNGNEISIPAIQGTNGAALIRPTIEEVSVVDTIADDDRFILNDVSATIGTKTKYTLWSSIKTALSLVFATLVHKSRHATGGADALTPADIGAATLVHKSRHATGGADALSPSDIGAASLTSGKVTPTEASSAITTYTASHTLALADAGKLLLEDSTGTIVVTIPTNATVAFPVGTEIELVKWNTGAVIFSFASGVNWGSLDGLYTISGRYGVVVLKQFAPNIWLLAGALA